MPLLNCNGEPYTLDGNNRQFDPKNPEHRLFDVWDEEAITIGGSPVEYYEVMIQSGSVDPLFLEDRGKLFSQIPIVLRATYEPIPSKNYGNAFGYDAPDEMVFEFNYRSVLKAIGHPPKIGSRLRTPHLQEDWVIITHNTGQYKMWGVMSLTLLCSRFQESLTTGEGKVTAQRPNLALDEEI